MKRTINDPGYIPTVSNAGAITVEGACVVSANIIEGAAGLGIVAGTDAATQDLNVNGNLVLFSNIGIGFGSSSSYGQIVISGNQVRGASGGAIVPVFLNSSGNFLRVAGSTDYGNQYDAQISNAFLGNNRSY